MGKYAEKIVLITGSSRGVGHLLATYFLSQGAVVLGVSKTASCPIDHRNYRHFSCDISSDDDIQKLFGAIRKQFQSIDILINNAAVLTSQYALIMTAENARSMIAVNMLAPFLMSREAAKLMRKGKWGRIINIGSMAASLEPQGDSIYAACKSAMITVSNVLAKEFAPFNVTCNTLGITAFQTDMLSQLPRDKVDAVIARLPIARYACEDDIVNVIDFFASERSSYITAQTVYLGGVN